MDSILAVKDNLPEAVARSRAVTDANSLYDTLTREVCVCGKESQAVWTLAGIKQPIAA